MTHCVTQQQPFDFHGLNINNINKTDFKIQSTPNPCNKETQVTFNLKNTSKIELTIFNSLGQKICTPLNSLFENGDHFVTILTEYLDEGIYFLTLPSEQTTKETIKLIVNQ
jgi:hypothetical protein